MTPRTKEQNEAIRRRRILQIKETAANVYLEKGLQMEMGDIAKAAELGRGTIYHYYNNKLSLLEELLDDAFDEAEKITSAAITEDTSPIVRLEQYAVHFMERCLEKPFIYILYKNFLYGTETIPVRNIDKLRGEFQTNLYSPIIKVMKEGVACKEIMGIDADTACNFFFGSLIGTIASQVKNRKMIQTLQPNWAKEIVTMLIKGIKR
ncbi:TetR/AcrR family transcriptional regulator [Bacillus songklensis]